MDPTETLRIADQAVSDCNSYEAHVALQHYRDWRASGGFEPHNAASSGKAGDEFARDIARRLEDLDRQSAAGFAAFLAAFPQTERNYGTGGGCTAWIIEKTRGGRHLLITDGNLTQPCMTDSFLSCGAYDEEGNCLDEYEANRNMTWDEALTWARETLAKL